MFWKWIYRGLCWKDGLFSYFGSDLDLHGQTLKKRDSHVILCNETTIKTVFFLLVTELEFQDLYKVLQKVKIRKFWFFQRMHWAKLGLFQRCKALKFRSIMILNNFNVAGKFKEVPNSPARPLSYIPWKLGSAISALGKGRAPLSVGLAPEPKKDPERVILPWFWHLLQPKCRMDFLFGKLRTGLYCRQAGERALSCLFRKCDSQPSWLSKLELRIAQKCPLLRLSGHRAEKKLEAQRNLLLGKVEVALTESSRRIQVCLIWWILEIGFCDFFNLCV